jgi:hypothetical protein
MPKYAEEASLITQFLIFHQIFKQFKLLWSKRDILQRRFTSIERHQAQIRNTQCCCCQLDYKMVINTRETHLDHDDLVQ